MTKQIDELMALADEWADQCGGCDSSHLAENSPYRKALHQALEAALKSGEPVAKYIGECPNGSLVQLFDDLKKGTELYTATPPAQTPPPRLTDEQIDSEIGFVGSPGARVDSRLIESAVRRQFGVTE